MDRDHCDHVVHDRSDPTARHQMDLGRRDADRHGAGIDRNLRSPSARCRSAWFPVIRRRLSRLRYVRTTESVCWFHRPSVARCGCADCVLRSAYYVLRITHYAPCTKHYSLLITRYLYIHNLVAGRRDLSIPVSYTHLRAHETRHDLVCRLLLEKKK